MTSEVRSLEPYRFWTLGLGRQICNGAIPVKYDLAVRTRIAPACERHIIGEQDRTVIPPPVATPA